MSACIVAATNKKTRLYILLYKRVLCFVEFSAAIFCREAL